MEKSNTDFEEFDLTDTVPPKDIFAFNELRSCADLKRMYDKKQIDISPAFQRNQAWKLTDQVRFLDSLLKNLPIPSMCIGLDIDNNQRIVIDGLQRISTIIRFLSIANHEQEDLKLPSLNDINKNLSGKFISEIAENHPEIIEAIENTTIPITILRCSLSNNSHMNYIFTIFHRLNTGGAKLNSQEIRNGIFNGEFSKFLTSISTQYEKELSALLNQENKRFSFEEFILRFFAFNDRAEEYQSPLTRFLNEYMSDYKNANEAFLNQKNELLSKTINILKKGGLEEDSKSRVIADAILYGISKNLSFLQDKDKDFLISCIKKMKDNEYFSANELQEGIFKTNKVKNRLEAAQLAFSGV